MKIAIQEFKKDPSDSVFKHKDTGEFSYSDGEQLESKILSTFKNSKDNSINSFELRQAINDWVTEYHFSAQRHNLLRHLNFQSSDKILELGCGCGAITRQFGERGALVTAVEGSLLRAQSAAARCSDLENVSVLCANFQDLDIQDKYDIVTLIGVLEYSPQYFKSSNPILECLKIAVEALKPDGILIIAIENQLGLKYLCGYTEDHLSIPYFGVEDRYTNNTPRTFGMTELSNYILDAGCKKIIFNFPYPDYKIPRVVFTEKAFENHLFSPAEIIRQIANRDYSNPDFKPVIDEQLATPVFYRNGLLPAVANSFLVLASRAEQRITKLYQSNLLATLYASDRHPHFNTQTNFIEEDGGVVVRKAKLINALQYTPSPRSIVTHQLDDAPYLNGLNLEAEMSRLIKNNNIAEFSNLLSALINYINLEGIQRRDPANPAKSIIKSDFIDCIPSNLIIKDKQLHYIDREWQLTSDVNLETLILRIIDSIVLISCGRPELQKESLLALLANAGINIDEQARQEHEKIVTSIHNLVYQGIE